MEVNVSEFYDFVVLIPTKDEELSIEKFIDWVQEGIKKSGLNAKLVLIDSSKDSTVYLAEKKGVQILKAPKSGLGNAYKFAQKKFSSSFVILGDADCSYDFRDLSMFVNAFQSGYDFVMGNRYMGTIEAKSMPFHHRYIGTPVTSWILRKLTNLPFRDVHCGMRAMSTEIYNSLPFTELGWEYAPEMVITAAQLSHKSKEVPINFLRTDSRRKSHFKRVKFPLWESVKAGFGAIRISLLYSAETVFKIFSKLLILGSLPIYFIAKFQNRILLGIAFEETTRIIASTIILLGITLYFMSLIFEFVNNSNSKSISRMNRVSFNSLLIINVLNATIFLCIIVGILILIILSNDIYLKILIWLKFSFDFLVFYLVICFGFLVSKILKFQIESK
jgi:hypothetical protein